MMRKFVYFPSEEEFAKKYFSNLGPLPSINELRRNISVVLVNTHRAIFHPRPTMPGNISNARINDDFWLENLKPYLNLNF